MKFWFVQVQHGGDVHENVRFSRSDAKRWAVDTLRTQGEVLGPIDWTDKEGASHGEIRPGTAVVITYGKSQSD